jgi:hypothetical protein
VWDVRNPTQLPIEQLIPAAPQAEQTSAGVPRLAGERGSFSDRELVRFAALHGAVTMDHVRDAFSVGRTSAYRRVAALIEAGLLERLEILSEAPSVLRATRAGLRYVGLDLGLCTVSAGTLLHQLWCTSTALMLERDYEEVAVLGERELRFIERSEGRTLYSAKLGERPDDPTDSLTEQVFTNVSYILAHREADPDSAERLARVAGTEPSFTTTTKVGGRRENWWSRPEGTRTPPIGSSSSRPTA